MYPVLQAYHRFPFLDPMRFTHHNAFPRYRSCHGTIKTLLRSSTLLFAYIKPLSLNEVHRFSKIQCDAV